MITIWRVSPSGVRQVAWVQNQVQAANVLGRLFRSLEEYEIEEGAYFVGTYPGENQPVPSHRDNRFDHINIKEIG